MKKFIIIAIILFATSAHAGWNLNFWGSDDKHHKNRGNRNVTQPVNPVSIPEPATLILLGGGLVALAGYKRWRGGK